MKRSLLVAAVFSLLGLGDLSAQAQKKPAAPAAAPAPAAGAPAAASGGVQYRQKTVYDFDDDTVEGDLVRPDGELVDSRRGAKHSSLIKIRENFIPEMLKSVEAL